MAHPPLNLKSSFTAWTGVFLLLAMAVFSQIHHFGFLIYDDPLFVSENPFIRGGLNWKNIQWALSAGLFFQTVHVDYWQPMTVLLRMLEMQLFGRSAGGYHLISLLLHFTNSVLLFYFLLRLTNSSWKAGLAAAIFVVHPLQVTSVAWITEQKGLLSSFFGFLALIQYIKNAGGNSFKQKFWVSLWFAFSLMSKPILVMLPVIFLLLDFWPLQRFPKTAWNWRFIFRIIFEKWALFLLSFLSYLVTWFCSPRRIFSDSIKRTHSINAIVNYVKYFLNFIKPDRLFIISPYQYNTYPVWMTAASIFILIVISYQVLIHVKKQPQLTVGWFWFVFFLLPFVWLIRLESRFMYFSMIGFLIILACGADKVFKRTRLLQPFFIIICSMFIVFCAFKSHQETSFWGNDTKLFAHAYDLLPNDKQVNQLYAVALANEGKADDARAHFLKTLDHTAKDAIIYNNIASVFLDNGKVNEAIVYYEKAIRAKPDYAVGYNNLCDAYREANQYDQAIPYCEKALVLNPKFPSPNIILARIMKAKLMNEKAIQYYSSAIRIEPNFAEAFHERGILFAQMDQISKAVADFESAIRISPNNPEFYGSMAHALSINGKLAQANDLYRKALTLDPKNAQIHNNLANNLVAMKHFDEAIYHYEEAIRSAPNYAEAYNNFGVAQLEGGDSKKAVIYFERALKIKPDYLSAQKNLERASKSKF